MDPKDGKPTACVILCHGLGDSSQGWLDVAVSMLAPAVPHARFVLPTAPTRPITLNFGMPMPGWYDIESLASDRANASADGLDESVAFMRDLIKQQETEHGIPASRVVLAGFSQGGALSLYTGLTNEVELAGILSMSGYLLRAHEISPTEAGKSAKVQLHHGEADDVVRFAWGQATRDRLSELGVKGVEWFTYPGMGHHVLPQEISRVREALASWIPPLES